MVTAVTVPALTATSAVKRKAERDECPKRKEEEPPKKRPPLLSLEGVSRPRLEDNPLRKKRNLFDTNDEPVVKKKVRLDTYENVEMHFNGLKIFFLLFRRRNCQN